MFSFASFLDWIDFSEDLLWSYIGFPVILFAGIFLSIKSRFAQIRYFPEVVRNFISMLRVPESEHGIHPLKAFFACVGGCVGIGNVVGVCAAVQMGGPGALFWLWITALFGMMLKYAEVYLGMKFRVGTGNGSYQGGPMYFLQLVFKTMKLPYLVCILLCIYGVEVYQFSVVTESISANFHFDKLTVTLVLLGLVFYAGFGGVRRVGSISAWIIPIFVVLYVGMGGWVIMQHLSEIPSLFALVFRSAFTGHAALGGFVGSSLMVTVSHGIRRASYSGDLGVGYASVIHSESSCERPEKQAALVYFDLFLDSFVICTTTLLLLLVTGVWTLDIETPLLVQTALSYYFPYMHFFMPFFLFLLGYSTINAYFVVGLKCAEFAMGRKGRYLFFGYAAITLFVFSFENIRAAQTVMSLTNVLLLLINSYGILKLRKEISFELRDDSPKAVV